MFFMDVKDYKEVFAATSICMTNDPNTYKHSSLKHSMRNGLTAFFHFSLSKAIDCTKTCFGISVTQQGNRLLKYRDEQDKFKPSVFSIILMTDNGKLIKATDDDDFNMNMNSADMYTTLAAGNYIVAVDPIWNETASKDEAYKDIVFDIYSPEQISISAIEVEAGFRTL